MSKENEQDDILEDEDELIDEELFDEEDEDEDEEDSDKKEDKSKKKSNLKAKYQKLQGIAKRQRTKLNKAKEKPQDNKKVEKKVEEDEKKGLDKFDRYFLRGEGIKSEDEVKLVEKIMAETGKTVEQIVDTKYFQSELKDLRDEKATKDATPSGSKRSGSGSKGDVDYWIAKGGLPTDNPELARKVVAARMKQKRGESEFSSTPVID